MDSNAKKGETMKTEKELKDELMVLERKLTETKLGRQIKESSIKETKIRIETIEWALRS